MTTVYVVKVTNKVEGLDVGGTFSTIGRVWEYVDWHLLADSNPGNLVISIEVKIEAKARPFILTYIDDDNQKQYLGIDTLPGRERPYLSLDANDAKVFEGDVSQKTVLLNLEKYFNFVNLRVEYK